MPKYVIDRNITGLGSWSAQQLRAASGKSPMHAMTGPTATEC
jgi:hypothetical protein